MPTGGRAITASVLLCCMDILLPPLRETRVAALIATTNRTIKAIPNSIYYRSIPMREHVEAIKCLFGLLWTWNGIDINKLVIKYDISMVTKLSRKIKFWSRMFHVNFRIRHYVMLMHITTA